MLRFFAVLALVLTALSVRDVAALEPGGEGWDADVLAGLAGVRVAVRPLSADATAASLDALHLYAQVTLRLRREGIAVLEDGEDRPDAATLRVALDDLAQADGPEAFHDFWLTVDLVQDAQLVRHPSVRSPVVTWSRLATGSHPANEMPARVRDVLAQALDELLADYRHANPGARVPPLSSASIATPGVRGPEGD